MNNKIEQTAYYKWERAGKPQGRHEEFWLEAEKEIQAEQQIKDDIKHLWTTTKKRHIGKIEEIWGKVKTKLGHWS